MKKIFAALSFVFVPLALITMPVWAATGPNIVQNPSVETSSNGTTPDAWSRGGWGTNTATLSYLTNDAHTGTDSLKVTISSYTNGDRKWYSAPVAVTAGQAYHFSDWYKASVSSALVAEYQTSSGSYSYVSLATIPASASWQQTAADIIIPSGVSKVSIFHLIASVGWLQTDDSSLTSQVADPLPPPPTPPSPPPPPPPAPQPTPTNNLVPNSSLETVSSTNIALPANWTPNSWGTNNAAFSYLTSGQDGNRSVRVQMTTRSSGDAKWNFAAVPVTPGNNYLFSDYYQSNVTTDVDVAVTMSDGSVHWYWLGSAEPSSSWQQFRRQFTMPAGAVSASVMHILYSAGTLTTDNYSFTPYIPTGFNRALLSLTFDDSWRSIYTNGLPKLTQYGFKSTQYVLTGVSNQSEYMTIDMMKAFRDQGHEIASHTVDHAHLPQLTSNKLNQELANSKLWIQNNLAVTPTNFATPYGEYNTAVLNAIKQYYGSHRGVEEGYNSKDNFDIWDIKVQNILSTTTTAQVSAWVAQAQQTKTWLVLVYHEIGANIGGDVYNTPLAALDAQFNVFKQSGIAVVTVQQALNEIKAQQ